MRNLKILGLALIAMLSMSAVAASMASADELTAENYPATLKGSLDEVAVPDKFLTTTGPVSCKQANYDGTISGPTTTVEVTPTYNECTAFGFPAVIDHGNCKYLFHIVKNTTEGDVDLVCTSGELTVTAIGAGTPKCIVHVPPQSDITGTVKYSRIGAGTTQEITVVANLTGIDYTHTQGTGVGSCPSGSATNGTLEAKAKVTGLQDEGPNHIGLFLSTI